MNLGDIQYPKKEELQIPANIDGPWLDRILLAMNTNTRNMEQVLRENVEFATNTPHRIVTPKLQHGVEVLIANPLPGRRRCIGAEIINCDGQQPIGCPIIRNTSKGGDAQIGITVQYAPPFGRVDLCRNNVQVIGAGNVPTDFDTDLSGLGNVVTNGAFSWDINTTTGTPHVNSKINCLAAGFVLVDSGAEFPNVAGGSYRQTWIAKNGNFGGAITRWGSSYGVPGYFGSSSNGIVPVAAGDYLQLVFNHDAGVGLNLTFMRFHARYIAPDPATTAQCTIRLFAEEGNK